MSKKKTRWLNKSLLEGFYYRLCLNETEFQEELDDLVEDKKQHPDFVNAGSDATTHFFTRNRKKMAIVCLDRTEDATVDQVYGLLVHEAVHIWQEFAAHIGETRPGAEQEAYAIQRLSQSLIADYRKQKRKKEKLKENTQ